MDCNIIYKYFWVHYIVSIYSFIIATKDLFVNNFFTISGDRYPILLTLPCFWNTLLRTYGNPYFIPMLHIAVSLCSFAAFCAYSCWMIVHVKIAEPKNIITMLNLAFDLYEDIAKRDILSNWSLKLIETAFHVFMSLLLCYIHYEIKRIIYRFRSSILLYIKECSLS